MSAEAQHQGGHSPLAQFEVKPLFDFKIAGIDLSFTNSSLMLAIIVGIVFLFFFFGSRKASLVPGRAQGILEMTYEFIANMLSDTVGDHGKKYLPFVFSIFMLVFLSNIVGMVPYSFTVTSHIVVTFALALFVFVIINIIGFARHGFHFFHLFVPQGAPWWSLFLILPIEVISYLIRPCSLAIRLAVAMTAGHITMKIFAGFIVSLGELGFPMGISGILPLAFAILLVGLELLVAAVQAYIFSILVCVYLNDAVNMH